MKLGRIGATATLVRHCEKHEIDLSVFLAQYEANDWGILEEEDCHSNNMEMFALAGHVLGKYTLTTGEDRVVDILFVGAIGNALTPANHCFAP